MRDYMTLGGQPDDEQPLDHGARAHPALDYRAHITPDPETPPPEPEKDPPPESDPLPVDPPVKEPVPKPVPIKA